MNVGKQKAWVDYKIPIAAKEKCRYNL